MDPKITINETPLSSISFQENTAKPTLDSRLQQVATATIQEANHINSENPSKLTDKHTIESQNQDDLELLNASDEALKAVLNEMIEGDEAGKYQEQKYDFDNPIIDEQNGVAEIPFKKVSAEEIRKHGGQDPDGCYAYSNFGKKDHKLNDNASKKIEDLEKRGLKVTLRAPNGKKVPITEPEPDSKIERLTKAQSDRIRSAVRKAVSNVTAVQAKRKAEAEKAKLESQQDPARNVNFLSRFYNSIKEMFKNFLVFQFLFDNGKRVSIFDKIFAILEAINQKIWNADRRARKREEKIEAKLRVIKQHVLEKQRAEESVKLDTIKADQLSKSVNLGNIKKESINSEQIVALNGKHNIEQVQRKIVQPVK